MRKDRTMPADRVTGSRPGKHADALENYGHINMHIYIYVYIYICTSLLYVFRCIYIYIYVYICTYVFYELTETQTNRSVCGSEQGKNRRMKTIERL